MPYSFGLSGGRVWVNFSLRMGKGLAPMKLHRLWIVAIAAAMLAGCASKYTYDSSAATTCFTAKNADDLIKYCTTVLAEQPELLFFDAGHAYNNRGLGYLLKKQYDLALADLDQAVRLEGYEPTVYLNRGDAYFGKHDYDRAIADYDRAAAKAPTAGEIYLHRGMAYLWKQQKTLAMADFDRAVDYGGDLSTAAYFYRGVAHADAYDYDKAATDFRQVLDLKPDTPAAEDGLCQVLAFAGRTFEAMRHCERAVKAVPKADGALFARGYAALRNGDWKGALVDCDAAAEASPAPAAARYCSGYAHERLGDQEAAKAAYAAAHSADPKIGDSMRRLGIVPGATAIKPEV